MTDETGGEYATFGVPPFVARWDGRQWTLYKQGKGTNKAGERIDTERIVGYYSDVVTLARRVYAYKANSSASKSVAELVEAYRESEARVIAAVEARASLFPEKEVK